MTARKVISWAAHLAGPNQDELNAFAAHFPPSANPWVESVEQQNGFPLYLFRSQEVDGVQDIYQIASLFPIIFKRAKKSLTISISADPYIELSGPFRCYFSEGEFRDRTLIGCSFNDRGCSDFEAPEQQHLYTLKSADDHLKSAKYTKAQAIHHLIRSNDENALRLLDMLELCRDLSPVLLYIAIEMVERHFPSYAWPNLGHMRGSMNEYRHYMPRNVPKNPAEPIEVQRKVHEFIRQRFDALIERDFDSEPA